MLKYGIKSPIINPNKSRITYNFCCWHERRGQEKGCFGCYLDSVLLHLLRWSCLFVGVADRGR